MAKLQSSEPRQVSTLTRKDAQVEGSLWVGYFRGDNTTDASFRVPVLTTVQRAALDAVVGMVVYDSTLGKLMNYSAAGWGSMDGTAAGSMDAAYNGGATVTVDAASVTFNLASASSDYAVVVDSTDSSGTLDDMMVFQTTGAATVTDGIDLSDAGITNALNVGANTIAGTTAVVDFDNFDIDASGNTTIGGTLGVTGAVTLTAALSVGTTLDITGATTSESTVTIDVDAAEAFLIRENGDAADIFTVDTTNDAGDTTFVMNSKTTTGKGIYVDLDTTTGAGVHIDGQAVTTGDALRITVTPGTMEATGAAISVIDDGGVELFAVRDDGSIYQKGTAEGTAGFTLATGDLVVSDGDITVSAGEVAITDGVTTSGAGLTLTSGVTTAIGFDLSAAALTTGKAIDISDLAAITTGKAIHVDATGVTQTSGILVHIDSASTAITGAGRLFRSDHTGNAGSSAVLNEFASAATDETVVLRVTASGALALGTLLDLSGTAITTGTVLDMGGLDALTTGSAINVVSNSSSTSTRTLGLIHQDHASASGSTGLTVTQDAAAGIGVKINGIGTTGVALHIDNASGVQADNTGMVFLDHGGAMADGSNIIRIAPTGTPVEGSIGIEVVGGSKVMQGLVIDSDAATNSANVFTGDGQRSADTAVVAITANVAASNADSQVLRVSQASTTGANVPLAILQADVSEPLILFESTEGTGNSVDETNTTEGALVGFLRISVNGTDQYLTYNAAPSA